MDWIARLNKHVLQQYHTRLVGGFDEPFYQPGGQNFPARIQYRYDYERSALHELSHWCLAGRQRCQLPDYGYWYVPDQRTPQQQAAFFKVEIKPQALEKCFCELLDVPFAVSIDNFSNTCQNQIEAFTQAVERQYVEYKTGAQPLPEKVLQVLRFFQHLEK